ncbi:cell division protein FtsK [Phytoactinopolyspora sp. XMNu-373]|uniref:Cell division protein FtsK n=1 Tax=Phytoactinopolyspora mesophila TaxID=2650750 RepID=A0A7K3MCB8_9ACTN|nr:cell division protein FtsK [Phytoactinopolyspora mesophila]
MFVGLILLLLVVPWYAIRHPIISVLVGGSAWIALLHGPFGLAVAYVAVASVLVIWRLVHKPSFVRFVSRPVRSKWRGAWVYRRRWTSAMHMCGLSKGFGAKRYVPHVVRVRSDEFGDRVRIKLLMGQSADDFEAKTEALASTFGATGCRVETGKPGVIWLHFKHRDALMVPLPAPKVGSVVNLGALSVGRCEDGQPWRLQLLGTHVLVAGATNSGKGSVIWSTLRALAPGVRAGLVDVWAVDPKGGVELASGAPMFARFAYEPEDMVALVEDAAALIRNRAATMRGHTRLHTPTTSEPFVLLVVDELAFLTAYMPDRALSKRLNAALSVVLSQGRAVGVSVMAAVQDPRKEIINMRDLFPTRIGLRLTESDQVDMVLGDGARKRGARCDQIPESTPGIGYVLLEGQREPTRVRAAYVSDYDISAMTATYQAARTDHALSVPVVAGEVVG